MNTAKSRSAQAATRPASRWTPPAITLNDGAVEALKWLALILMTGDHVNKYLLNDAYPILFILGRMASPIFCFVLAFNLARPNTLERGVYARIITRLFVFAAIASVPYTALGTMKPGYIFFGWWPLNILATLMVATSCIFFLDRGRKLDGLFFTFSFVIGGALGEFWWPAILLCIGVWLYCRRPGWGGLILIVGSTAAFFVINRNYWALGALPIIFAAQFLPLKVSRTKYFFYVFYPAHLAVIWIIVWSMGR
jgi:hypothetical protein